ncbi:tetraacyldisaccharide 4'-kinase [Algoriphagus sp. AK58]|uniref:tetraacyldisaccharide 4'-kinase n=1 Tax=Algoriphagus sp. AK58 TaxID=1406877 RepID=UPI00164F2A26|nr:tetraacyldisaccharide 4'-kinase [Algoriphagus sp. AK58]MBC6365861.1 tetraacyldisaccharide 4'-kinase [Algoriphagus sp. AK58]
MPWYGFFLLPFAFIFRLITEVRNFLYDHELLKSHKSPIKTLVVGNLSVGGTGKTPMVEFLIHSLKGKIHLASLSRGYGRKTQGFLMANSNSSPKEIGDEPLQIFQKFKSNVPVFVGEDRVEALKKMAKLNSTIQGVILDDAFQHRKLKPDFSIILTSFSKPFFRDFLLPAGRLRESRKGARRAHVIIVTKCPSGLSLKEKERYGDQIRKYSSSSAEIFFSGIGYGAPYLVWGNKSEFIPKVVVVSGLADDSLFLEFCKNTFEVVDSVSFPDHYEYRREDATTLVGLVKKHQDAKVVLLTTEKDAEKLKSLAKQGFLEEIPIFALPIEVKFEPSEQEMLLSIIREKFIEK